jgi:hypothetical protein
MLLEKKIKPQNAIELWMEREISESMIQRRKKGRRKQKLVSRSRDITNATNITPSNLRTLTLQFCMAKYLYEECAHRTPSDVHLATSGSLGVKNLSGYWY